MVHRPRSSSLTTDGKINPNEQAIGTKLFFRYFSLRSFHFKGTRDLEQEIFRMLGNKD